MTVHRSTASDNLHWTTTLSRAEPGKIFIRGHELTGLMGRSSFGETLYLLWMGRSAPLPGRQYWTRCWWPPLIMVLGLPRR